MVTGSFVPTMLTATRLVLRNARRDRYTLSHRASVYSQASVSRKVLQRRLSTP